MMILYLKSFNQGLKHCIVQKLPLQKFLMIFMITDSGESVILVMLDLSSVFDTVDHTILISRLESYVGLGGVVLSWFKSFLTKRRFSVFPPHSEIYLAVCLSHEHLKAQHTYSGYICMPRRSKNVFFSKCLIFN